MRRNPYIAACYSPNRTDASFWMSRGAQGWADGEILSFAHSSPAKSIHTANSPSHVNAATEFPAVHLAEDAAAWHCSTHWCFHSITASAGFLEGAQRHALRSSGTPAGLGGHAG